MAFHTLKSALSKKKMTLDYCDPGEILDLCLNLVDSHSTNLYAKINIFLKVQCQAQFAFIILVQPTIGEALVTVVDDKILAKSKKLLLNINFFLQTLKLRNTFTRPIDGLDKELQGLLDLVVPKEKALKQITVVPVPAGSDSEQYYICIVDSSFTDAIITGIVKEVMAFCSPVLKRTRAYEREKKIKKQCQEMLLSTRYLLLHVGEIRPLLQAVMAQARRLTGAQICAILLVDLGREELVETIMEFGEELEGQSNVPKSQASYRFPMHVGITGSAVDTGALINVTDAKQHPMFEKMIDSRPGIETKNILCFPIREEDNIIGVAQLINKDEDGFFSFDDEEICTAFSIYCGICITQSLVHKQLRDACIRNKVSNELMLYHMQVGDKDVRRVSECNGYQHRFDKMTNIHLNTRLVPKREHVCHIVHMFDKLEYIKKFNIKRENLIRFLLYVQRGYRDVPYHNWYHAFSTIQFAYAAVVYLGLDRKLSDLQCMMYLLACVVHDLDHRGTTNSYQIEGSTKLAVLYSSAGSVMERHHLSQALCVLRAEGCDVLSGLSRRDYDTALFYLQDAVIATDLFNFHKKLDSYKEMAEIGYKAGKESHEHNLLCIMMNAADLSDQIKEWNVLKFTAAAVLTEFFHQGDAVKSRGDRPDAMMDRDRVCIPDLEIEFLSQMTIPLYKVAAAIMPGLAHCIKIQQNHILRWEASRPSFKKVPPQDALQLLLSDELDANIEAVLKELAT